MSLIYPFGCYPGAWGSIYAWQGGWNMGNPSGVFEIMEYLRNIDKSYSTISFLGFYPEILKAMTTPKT